MIKTVSKTDQLKEIILRQIKNGEYKPGDKLPSIQKICQTYNVSKHTVSQTMSNLTELGTVEVEHGKVTRVSDMPFRKIIEIIYAGITPIDQQEFWAEFYRGMVDEINATAGYSYTNRSILDAGSIDELKNLDFKNSVGALLVGTARPLMLDYLKSYGISFLMVYERVIEEEISYVSVDYRAIMNQMAGLFVKNRRSRIAYIGSISGKTDKGINTDRYECFLAALREHGIEIDKNLHQNAYYSIEDGYIAMKKLLEKSRPDGLLLGSDTLAPGVYRSLHEAGIPIPQAVSIAGCDNLEIGKYLVPSLTTIELNRYEVGRQAAANLIRNIRDGKNGKAMQIDLNPEIIIRESLY